MASSFETHRFAMLLRMRGNTGLILRSLRSKRLEGWTQQLDSRPSFETREDAFLRMRSEIYSQTLRMRSQTLMVRSASSRVSNHEATGEAAMIRANRKMHWQ